MLGKLSAHGTVYIHYTSLYDFQDHASQLVSYCVCLISHNRKRQKVSMMQYMYSWLSHKYLITLGYAN